MFLTFKILTFISLISYGSSQFCYKSDPNSLPCSAKCKTQDDLIIKSNDTDCELGYNWLHCCPKMASENIVFCTDVYWKGKCMVYPKPEPMMCVNVKHEAVSVKTFGRCVRVYIRENCQGSSVVVWSRMIQADLNSIGMTKMVASFSECFPIDKTFCGQGSLKAPEKIKCNKEDSIQGIIKDLTTRLTEYQYDQDDTLKDLRMCDKVNMTLRFGSIPNIHETTLWYSESSNQKVHYQKQLDTQRTETMKIKISKNDLHPRSSVLSFIHSSLGSLYPDDNLGKILPTTLGGTGADPINIFPQSDYNKQIMSSFENLALKIMMESGEATITVNLFYPTKVTRRPNLLGFHIVDRNGFVVIAIIPNPIKSQHDFKNYQNEIF